MAAPDGAEDVQDFLQRIRELGDRRDREDEERARKLEDDIVQGRKERQARRAGEWTLDVLPACLSAGSQAPKRSKQAHAGTHARKQPRCS